MVVLTAVNSLAVIGLVVVLSWLAGLLMWETFKRYVRPRLERRRWLREYNRQRAIEYTAMLARFASTVQRDPGSIYGLCRAPDESEDRYKQRIALAAVDIRRHSSPIFAEQLRSNKS